MNKKPLVSIIIPTYNRGDILEMCLEKICNDKFINITEIIIVDDGSDKCNVKKNAKSVNKLKNKNININIYFNKNLGPARARNFALEKSVGEIIIIINDDTIVENNFLERHIYFHKINKSINKALLGPFLNHPDIKIEGSSKWLFEKTKMHFSYPKMENKKYQLIPWIYFWTNNISIKKSFFNKNNLKFDNDFMTAAWEDVEFGWRAKECGLKIYLDKDLISYHYHQLNFDDIMNRFFSHGRGLFTLSNKIPYKVLPPLAKNKYRMIAKIILKLFFSKNIVNLLKQYLKKQINPNNILMQIIVINQKIEGFEYQRKLSKV